MKDTLVFICLLIITIAVISHIHPKRVAPANPPWPTRAQFQALESRVTTLEAWAQREGMKIK